MTGDEVRWLYSEVVHMGRVPKYLFVRNPNEFLPLAKELGDELFKLTSVCGMIVKYDISLPPGQAKVVSEDKAYSRFLIRKGAAINRVEDARLIREDDDICGYCGEPGADKVPAPIQYPEQEPCNSEYVHTICENNEENRAARENWNNIPR